MDDEFKKATVDSLRGTVGPIPTVNPTVAKIGEKLKGAKKYADQYYVKDDIPLIGGMTLGDFLLGQAPEEVERWGQGDYPFRNPNDVVKTGGNRLDVWKTGRFLPTFDVGANVVAPLTGLGLATKGMKVGMSIEDVGDGAAKANALRQVKPAKPEPYRAPRNEMGFYSALDEAVGNIQSPRGTGEQYLKQLQKTPGVKAEEITYRGLDKFLMANPKTSVEDIKKYLAQNEVRLDRKTLKGDGEDFESYDEFPNGFREGNRDSMIEDMADDEFDYYMSDRGDEFKRDWMERNGYTDEDLLDDPNLQRQADEYAEETAREYAWESARENAEEIFEHDLGYTVRGNANYGEWRVEDPRGRTVSFGDRDYFRDRDDAFNAAQNDALESGYVDTGTGDGVQYSRYQMPGGSDYREELFTHNSEHGNFRSDHFEEHGEDLLMHRRMTDRYDDDKKTLTIEEMQSDWLQQGRDEGFLNTDKQSELVEQVKALRAEKERQLELAKPYTDLGQDAPVEIRDAFTTADDAIQAIQRRHQQNRQMVPDAPFKKTMHEFQMKSALNEAAEGGYDRLAWSPGEVHDGYYNFTQVADRIDYDPITESLRVYKNGDKRAEKMVPANELHKHIGADMVDTLLKSEQIPLTGATSRESESLAHTLTGEDIRYGDMKRRNGMEGFYDQMLPKYMSNHLKKFGVKPQTMEINQKNEWHILDQNGRSHTYEPDPLTASRSLMQLNQARDGNNGVTNPSLQGLEFQIQQRKGAGKPVHYVDITPEMREEFTKRGQPMFAAAPLGMPMMAPEMQEEEVKPTQADIAEALRYLP